MAGSLFLVAALCFLVGCGGSTANVTNPGPPGGQTISVAFMPAPPTSITINSAAQFTAVVNNDPSNQGVDWSLTCQSNCGTSSCVGSQNSCGTLSAQHTGSGQTVTYTPPASFAGNTMSVGVAAFATADHTKNVLSPIAVSAFGNILQGSYVFQAKGSDFASYPYQIAGVITLDGNGNVIGGLQTQNSVFNASLTTPIDSGSSYFVGADGRGMLILNTDQSGSTVTETFSLVVLSNARGLIAEADGNTAVGTLELQDPSAINLQPSAGYAFVLSGTDYAGTPAAFGGVLNIDSPGNISGNGSWVDQDYTNVFASCAGTSGITGTVAQPSPNPFGVVVFTLSAPGCFGSATLTGYVVDSTSIQVIETDDSGGAGFLTSGIAMSQGSATGSFTDASFAGSYVVSVLGIDLVSFLPSSLTDLSQISVDGAGNVTGGFLDGFLFADNLPNNPGPYQISAQISGAYKADIHGIGRVQTQFTYTPQPFPHFPYRPNILFFLTGSGKPALVLVAGGEQPAYPSLGIGVAYPQAANAQGLSLSGAYGVSFTQQNGFENDGSGQVNAGAGTLSGLSDSFNNGFGIAPTLVSGTFAAADLYGRLPGTLTVMSTPLATEYYLVDPDDGFFVETDLVNPGSGQVGLGYFTRRTPVCAGCP